MNGLFHIAAAYMKRQRKRTTLTVIGVLLACALVCSIGIFLTSVQHMFQTEAEYESGSHEVAFGTSGEGYFTREQALDLAAHHNIRRAGLVVEDESILIRSAEDGEEQGGVIRMAQRDAEALAMIKYHVTEGRLPQNDGECMLSDTAVLDWGLDAHIGDVMTVTVVRGEEQAVVGTRTLTWVGTYDSSNSRLVTQPNGGEHHFALYAQLSGRDKDATAQKILQDNGLSEFAYQPNSNYLRATGTQGGSEFQVAFTTTFILLACIILGAMVLVIRNSFAMSTSEKISQFGLLRCVGASPRQIRSIVFFEALLTWAIALPLGLILAVVAMVIVFAIVQRVELSALQYLSLVVSAWPFLLTAALSLIAVLLSARAPARRAASISPIEAVRGNTVFEEPKGRVGVRGRITGALFGYPGVLASKNIRRNRKRYLTTVLSVIVSITLFISLTSFSEAMSETFKRYGQINGMDAVLTEYTEPGQHKQFLSVYDSLLQDVRTERAAKCGMYNAQLPVEEGRLGPTYLADLQQFPEMMRYFRQPTQTQPYEGTVAALQGKQVYMDFFPSICVVDRQTYAQLQLQEGSMSYDELVAARAVAINQKVELSGSGGFRVTDITCFEQGETLYPTATLYAADGDPEDEEDYTEHSFPMVIGALTAAQPWFSSELVIFIPEENVDLMAFPEGYTTYGLRQEGRTAESLLDEANNALYIKAVSGQEDSLLGDIEDQVEAINAAAVPHEGRRFGLYFNNYYNEVREGRNTILVVNIFVYGFMVVVILICAVNVLNTISTNIQMRKRELAMLRAIGMSQRQLMRMLLVECLLYGLIGTFWGAIAGFGLGGLLFVAIHNAFEANLMHPFLYVAVGMLGAIALSLLAGLGPIHRVVKASVVEEIRAQDA